MTTADAAMSMYLNGNQNVRGRPNENYARELMELFCLGPNAPDGSAELHAGRRRGPRAGAHRLAAELDDTSPDYGEVTFTPGSFETGRQDVPRPHASRPRPRRQRADGPAAVNAALDAVLGHPSHKQYLIRKLWSEFIATPIPDATLAELMAVYDPAGPLRPLLRGILGHPLIFESLDEPNLIKPPIVYLVGVLRQLGAPMKGNYMTGALTNMQQRPYRPPNVAGWEGGMSWLNTNTVQGRFDAVLRAQFLKYRQQREQLSALGAGGGRRRGGRDGGRAGRARPRVGRPAVAGARDARRAARLRHGGADRQPGSSAGSASTRSRPSCSAAPTDR